MPPVRLLTIEDDPDVAELLYTYFQMLDYEIHQAADGQDGIALAREKHPTLILLDVMLPDMSGWDVAVALRQASLTKYIPIIFLTQLNLRSERLRGLELGADDYITKPFDVEELSLRVQAVIRRATSDRLYEPRTGLPTGPLADTEIQQREGKRGWTHLTARVEHLAAFRDVYGFMAADEALGLAADVLREVVGEFGTKDDFIGLGDEDVLVLLTHTRRPAQLEDALRERFAAKAQTLYNFRDAERGYVVLNPGTAEEAHVPLMQLAVGRPAKAGAG